MNDTAIAPTGERKKFFYGWVITGLVFLNLGMAYGAQYSFGVFFPSLIAEFHWSRQSLAGAFSLYAFMYSALGIILGRWTDRFGPRIVLTCGSLCLGTGIALISQITAPWHLYLVYGLLASWGMSATYFTSAPTVIKWFIEKRGLAVGLSHSGLGIGIIVIPPLTGFLISALGWRQACIVLGASVFLVLATTACFLVGRPENMGLQPDGGPASKPRAMIRERAAEVHWSVGEAIRTPSFWVLTAVFFATWIVIFVPLVHLVIFALDIGLKRETAFFALAVLGGASTAGRFLMGTLSDRIGRKPTLLINLGGQVLCWLWILWTSSGWMLIVFAALFGFSYGGASSVFPAIVGDYFGRLKAGSVLGAIFTLAGAAVPIGPWFAGFIHDRTGGYGLVFLMGAVSNFVALLLALWTKPPKKNEG